MISERISEFMTGSFRDFLTFIWSDDKLIIIQKHFTVKFFKEAFHDKQ